MKKISHLFVGIVLTLFTMIAWGQSHIQTLTYSTATVSTDLDSVNPGSTLWLAFKLDLKPGWHVYWKNPGQSGMPPRLQVSSPQIKEIGELQYFPPTRIFVAHLVNYGYKNSAVFYLPIRLPDVLDKNTFQFEVKAQWLICQEDCVPEEAIFNFILPVTDKERPSVDFYSIHKGLDEIKNIPLVPVEISIGREKINFKFTKDNIGLIKDAYVYLQDALITEIAQKQSYKASKEGLIFNLTRLGSDSPGIINGLLEVEKEGGIEYFKFEAVPKMVAIRNLTLPLALSFAFLGGMLLNLMPCVFPILSLKILSLCQQKSIPYLQKIYHAFSYTGGILVSFSVIAFIIIVLRTTGNTVGWGFQMQSPLFLLAMIYVLVWVSLTLFGYINLWIPIPNGVNKITVRHPLVESFMTGLLITLVSTPCTAPFMAPALGFAFSQSASVIVALIMMIGLGLSFPFILIAIFPGLTFFIPKSGPWLKTFKEFLAFPMLLTAIWLCWILLRHISIDAFIIVLIALTAFLLFLWINKQTIKNKIVKAFLVFVVLMPILFSFYFVFQQNENSADLLEEKPLFSLKYLDELLKNNKKVFVNVTADWCINCKVNETLVLSTDAIKEHFNKNEVVYLKADWTHQDDEISSYLERFNRYGVPLYVYYPEKGDPIVLPQILTPDIIFEQIK